MFHMTLTAIGVLKFCLPIVYILNTDTIENTIRHVIDNWI